MKTHLFILCIALPFLGFAQLNQIDLPIDWEGSTTDFTTVDFGGNASTVLTDPNDPTNTVLEVIKTGTAQTWAGTTLSTSSGLATAIPFAAGSTSISVAVWSPDAGIPVRLKAEDHTDPTISVETEANTTVANAWDTLVFDFSNQAAGTAAIDFTKTYDMLSIFYNFGTDGATAGAKTYYADEVVFGAGSGPALAQIDLPINWEGSVTDYTVTDFGGNASTVVVDPTDPNNMVLESTKTATAQVWAGTTLSTPSGLATAIPFASGSTEISVVVWSPDAGIPVRLKAEDKTDPTISVETETNTTVAAGWDTLVFDFSNQAAGTAAIDFTKTYDMLSIFYNFGTDGATAGAKTYYADEVFFGAGSGPVLSQIDLPIDWEGAAIDYSVTDFGGNASAVVVDPTDPTNMVLESEKTASAQTWAGTTLSTPSGLATPIPFVSGSTEISVVVWSPDAGTPVRLKAEDHTDPTIFVETEVNTSVAAGWDTLVFDFSNNVSGTPAIDFNNTYDMLSIFYNFGTDGATAGSKTYYADEVFFGAGSGTTLAQIDLPIDWEGTVVDFTVTDFGGNASAVVVDPTDPTNMVLESEKTASAQTWAGTTLSTPSGLATPIPFASGSTEISVVVWSPDAGIPVRLKAEDHTDPTISVETEVNTTVAAGWDTLVFDFSNQAAGTAAIDFTQTYDMLSIFYNFGTDGATAGSKTYYADEVFFGAGSGGGTTLAQIDLPISWDDTATVDYTVTDFGGNASVLVVDPTNPNNMVLETEKTTAAQTWAGTTLSTPSGLATAIPFAAGDTKISVAVWSPDAGIPIRLKAEDHTDPTISVETEATTTVAAAWDTLVFDFANEATGTAAINFSNTYDLLSIFYNFGTDGPTAGSKTYYADDVVFGDITIGLEENAIASFSVHPNPSRGLVKLEATVNSGEVVHLSIVNSTGRLIKEMSFNNSQINTEIELNVPSGVYFMRVQSGNSEHVEKILIRK